MDTKIIQQYGEDILSYRLRTARQKERMQYEDFDKQLITLSKKRKALYQQKRNLGWRPLHPPVQRGWKRFFVLKEDVAAGKHAAFYQGILDKINTTDWSWRKDFLIRKRKRGRKIYVVKPQKLKELRGWEFKRLQFSDTEKQYFETAWELDWSKQPAKKYVFKEPWRFILVVRPNMIDKTRIIDTELEQMIKQINYYLERNYYWTRLNRIKGIKRRWWKEGIKKNEVNKYKNKSLHQILDLINEEKI